MIKRIINFIQRLFGREDIEDYGQFPSYSDVSNTPAQNMLKNKQKQIKSSNKFDNNVISKNTLMRKIKTNIFFLEQLLDTFTGHQEYISYYRKIKEMKNQSEACFKIVHRMKEEAPYYHNTLKTILRHTNTISQLLDSKS